LSKASTRFTKTGINIPVILTLSVIPDIDILIPFLEHRGPAHSVLMMLLIFIPVFVIYHKKAIPYFLAMIQHSLIGDYMAGGRIQLLWPFTTQYYGLEIDIKSQVNITVEWIMFITSIIIMTKTKDIALFFQQRNSNLILTLPTFTVLLPTFLSFPLDVPLWLIPPHLVYIFLFLTSIIIGIRTVLKKHSTPNSAFTYQPSIRQKIKLCVYTPPKGLNG
jgi:hypothetical protein